MSECFKKQESEGEKMKKWLLGIIPVAAAVLLVNIGGSGCANLGIAPEDVGPAVSNLVALATNYLAQATNAPPDAPDAPPDDVQPPPPPSGPDTMTDAQARAYAETIQFLDGSKRTDQRLIDFIKLYGKNVSHFGGGCTPGQPLSNDSLFKPQSENDGNLVVLIANNIYCPAISIGTERKTVRSGSNGIRSTFRFKHPGSYYSGQLLTVDGYGSWRVKDGSKKQTFKLTPAASTPSTNAIAFSGDDQPPPAAIPDVDSFAWVPSGNGIKVHVPKAYGPWKAVLYSRRKHATLWGPVDSKASDWTIPMSPAQIVAASKAAGDDGTAMFFTKTTVVPEGGELNNAAWRIMDPSKEQRGNADMLRKDEDK